MTRIGGALPVGPSVPEGRSGRRGRLGGAALLGLGLLAAGLAGLLSAGGASTPSSVVAPSAATATPQQERAARQTLASLPLRFERNVGQTDAQVRYLARGQGFALFLTPREAVLSLTEPGTDGGRPGSGGDPASEGAVVRMRLAGANPHPAIAAAKPLGAKSNYFIGNERHVGVSNYREVTYSGVYPGIDVTWHGRQGAFEYDFMVAPGADPSRIALDFKGAERMSIDGSGDLLLKTAAGTLRQPQPVVYQRTAGGRRAVAGRYVLLADQRVGFRVGAYDRSRTLVIDPVITYSTYAGGISNGGVQDQGADVAVDGAGNAYIAGNTQSLDFPTTAGAHRTTYPAGAGSVAFVMKVDTTAAGPDSLRYSTFLGGASGSTDANGIAVDGSGNAYVTGLAFSTAFPSVSPLPGSTCDPAPSGNSGAGFVTKVNPAGSDLAYSTCLGSPAMGSVGSDVAVDATGAAYVTGFTFGGFPTTAGAFQSSIGGATDAFVAKLQPMASAGLAYATYLGGTSDEGASDIALDGANNVYVTGVALAGFPTTAGAFQTVNAGGSDPFVAKLNTAAAGAASLVYSTYLGGSADDPFVEFFPGADPPEGGIAVLSGSAYVTGNTESSDFPTQGALQGSNAGGQDAFVAKLNTAGTGLAYSTYLGGAGFDNGLDVAVDAAGSAHVFGGIFNSSFPTADPLPGSSCATGSNGAFVSKLNPSGSAFSYSTCIPGATTSSVGGGIAVDAAGDAYAVGTTLGGGIDGSDDLEIVNGFQEQRITLRDAFLVRVAPSAARPRVGALAPRGGPTSGETRVAISGQRFTGTTAVSFGGTPASSFTVDSDSQITAVAPARAAGRTFVTVTNGAGSSPARSTLAAYSYGEGGWKATAPIPTARRVGHAATLLADGRVLVTGGRAQCPSSPCTVLSSAQLYDPRTGTWTTTENMATARIRHTATLLPNGRVLVAGGFTNGAPFTSITSAEIYDPASGTWSPAASMGLSRQGHTATLLAGPTSVCGTNCGKVLVAGGSAPAHAPRNTSELYDPASNTWAPTGLLAATRSLHTAAAIPVGPASVCGSRCGRVLVSGGFHSAGAPPSELYDPLVGTWSAPTGGPAGADRTAISSNTLLSGRVVAAGGGCFETVPGLTSDSQMFDPAAGTWAATGLLAGGRASHASAALPNGKMLVAGGYATCQGSYHTSAEVFDPGMGAAGGYRPGGALQVGRGTDSYTGGPTATLLSSDPTTFAAGASCGENCGRVLIVGGTGSKIAELYTPPPAISGGSGSGSTAGGTAVTITGTGLNNGLRAVRFGSTPAASFTADSYGQITALSPAHDAGTVDITVVTEGGEARRSNAFTYSTPPPPPPPGQTPPGEEPPAVTPPITMPPLSVTPLTALQDLLAPNVSGFGLNRSVFAVGPNRTPISGSAAQVRRGTTFRYTLSEAATVRIAIGARRSGRRRAGRCVAPSRRLRRARRCTRLVARGTLTRTSRAGANRVAFSGRVGSRALRPGRYQARITATDAARNVSRPRTVFFRIVRR